MSIKLGVSACVIGDNVRFDSGHKRNQFICEQLSPFIEFVPVCPEVGIGLPVPRPTIRLLDRGDEIGIRLVETKNADVDHTEKMEAFSRKKADHLATMDLCGYVVCAKSPTCGMERVKVYRENGYVSAEKIGVGLYTKQLMKRMPWLPIEEDGRLHDPVLRENFVFRIFALRDLYDSMAEGITRRAIVEFHSRYKLVLMAHSPLDYKSLGKFVATIADHDIDEFYIEYRTLFMQAIANRASRKNNTNVLMHLQGYFKRDLDKKEKEELSGLIHSYRQGIMPLLAPLTLINHHLQQHPDDYLQHQSYLNPYPESLRLRYGL
ncbi:hypothetical protein A1OO_14185 [Enterovibrio norvegicus FF-33]|uniref:DUF1722 domain-containing protein n=1 Tax=Enterovibrio norvegicus FF-454 TaxID=1185651 RepID=A0A1E5CBV0_9GAMM|nr:DUF523 and DUF1722 domain-containing protein [Enterovibrio norvegicus]OEE62986.1 hypothetical protein A1OK_20605 [Enterovibrio norvegicus FF-454]OEE66910.1 hypothetical protein A1OO_14185 [Enterovibrio norvegicus FF-33]OEE77324.1 hypothetical protein A1OQ_05600 [Enterovibrio norvegicus FF-162]